MSEKRPNVFKTQESIVSNNPQPEPEQGHIEVVVPEVYKERVIPAATEIYEADNHFSAFSDEMRKRTEEEMKLRDEALAHNERLTAKYADELRKLEKRDNQLPRVEQKPKEIKQAVPEPKALSPQPKTPTPTPVKMSTVDPHIQALSQPQFGTTFDVIPLPSEGKLYKNRKSPNVRVGYLTTADENILTSPNLLQSGEFLEILINRKLLETDLRYHDLHLGDRNAIMLWLRSTSYGEMYPVTLFDEEQEPFETEIDLTTLKTKKLGAEPDEDCNFSFYLPVSKVTIKFRLLTVGDVEDIDRMVEADTKAELPVNNVKTYMLERQVVWVNGVSDVEYIKDFVNNMRIKDANALRTYIDKIESGIDMNIEVQTPRGGSVKTFLPLNFRFFWPEFTV